MAESSPNWLDLPRDITASILMRLGPVEILSSAQRVCSQWRSISKEPSLWTTIDMREKRGDVLRAIDMSGGKRVLPWTEVANKLCWRAIDRSCGSLVELSIEDFLTDELLPHITASCNGIKRLRLAFCSKTTDEGLAEAAAKLPLLEDLELSFNHVHSEEALEAIGVHCPRLKTLKLNFLSGPSRTGLGDDEQALAISKAMPGLRHLQLLGNRLTNAGLDAILRGCPHLEDLDLRLCLYVDLTGVLGKRCAERIKNLRRPSDPVPDFLFLARPPSMILILNSLLCRRGIRMNTRR